MCEQFALTFLYRFSKSILVEKSYVLPQSIVWKRIRGRESLAVGQGERIEKRNEQSRALQQ